MRKGYIGTPIFDPDGRFQRGGRAAQQSPPADPAKGGGLPGAPTADPNAGNAPATGSAPAASTGGSVDLSKLYQNLQKLNIAAEPTHPNVTTLAQALRTHFGDQSEISVDGQKIKIKTPQGERQLEIYTRRSQGNTRAFLRLRVDERTTRPIGQLLRYGDEYYINANLLKNMDKTPTSTQKKDDQQKATDNKKPQKKLPKSVLYGAGALAAGGTAIGLARFLGGGGDDDDDKNKQQSGDAGGTVEVVDLNNPPAPSGEGASASGGSAPTSGGVTPTSGEGTSTSEGVTKPRVDVTERTPTTPNIVVNVPPAKVVREITSGEAPVQALRKGNETVVKAGTSNGVFTLNIGADKTLILKDKEVVGDFPTADIIRAVGQMADGKTEKEIKRSGEFDDLLKNPWFLVAIALALTAFARHGGRG